MPAGKVDPDVRSAERYRAGPPWTVGERGSAAVRESVRCCSME